MRYQDTPGVALMRLAWKCETCGAYTSMSPVPVLHGEIPAHPCSKCGPPMALVRRDVLPLKPPTGH
jgi:hypothetical protein